MKLKKILIALIVISFLVSVFVDIERVNIENKYNTVETVADLYNFEKLAGNQGTSVENILNKLKQNGLKGIAVPEVTLNELSSSGNISIYSMSDLQNIYNLTGTNNPAINSYIKKLTNGEKKIEKDYTVVTTNDVKTYDFLKASLNIRIPKDKLKILDLNNSYAFLINEDIDNFKNQGLGFNENDLQLCKTLGLDIIPRIENFNSIKDSDIDNYIKLLKKYNVKTVIFGGNDVLGNPNKISYAASQFKKYGITVGIIDTPMGKKLQSGTENFTKFDNYRGVKVYGLSDAETQKYDITGITDRWYRSIIERDVRIIYMRAKVDSTKTSSYNMNQNIVTLKDINKLTSYAGYKLGIAKPLEPIHQSKLIEIFISIGAVAGGVLLLMLFGLKDKPSLILTVVGMIVMVFVILSKYSDLGVKTVALASSIIYPSLAIGYFINNSNKILEEKLQKGFIAKALSIFIKTVLISLIGGLMIAAIMADSKYLLKLDYFRGVKLSFTVPVIVYILYYCYKVFKINTLRKVLNTSINILNMNIKIWHVIAVLIAGIIGIIYISRTGNTPIVQPSSIELKFRDLLEHYLVARPRTKEFLVGYPALILAIYAAIKKSRAWNFILGILASIGILSMPNTMSHVESVLKIALERTVISWIFGAVIGIVITLILNRIILWVKNLNEKRSLL